MSKDLFLCFTPLQVLIARSIILSEKYNGDKPDLYLFALSDSQRYVHYYNLINPLCSKSELITSLSSFPFYLMWIKKNFWRVKYRNIYLASIDSVLSHYILSWSIFDNIITFDDGTANILTSSIYYNDNVSFRAKLKKLIWFFFGNRYTKKKIIDKSSMHYTLYPGFKNIVSSPELINVFNSLSISCQGDNEKRLSIFIGTVWKDVITKNVNDIEKIVHRVHGYLKDVSESRDIIYFPHPRDEFNYFPGTRCNHSSLIAEESIIELLKEYKEIELVGFASSAQFNLMTHSKITNVVIDSELIKPQIRELIKMLSDSGAKLVSVDYFE